MTTWSRLDAEVTCPDCGSCNQPGDDGTWRWNGENWEHRCKGLHPQVGHFVVGSDGAPRVEADVTAADDGWNFPFPRGS